MVGVLLSAHTLSTPHPSMNILSAPHYLLTPPSVTALILLLRRLL